MSYQAGDIARPARFGAVAFGLLLAAYFAVLAVASGWAFTLAQFFWIGIAFNAAGIAYIANKLSSAAREHALCTHA